MLWMVAASAWPPLVVARRRRRRRQSAWVLLAPLKSPKGRGSAPRTNPRQSGPPCHFWWIAASALSRLTPAPERMVMALTDCSPVVHSPCSSGCASGGQSGAPTSLPPSWPQSCSSCWQRWASRVEWVPMARDPRTQRIRRASAASMAARSEESGGSPGRVDGAPHSSSCPSPQHSWRGGAERGHDTARRCGAPPAPRACTARQSRSRAPRPGYPPAQLACPSTGAMESSAAASQRTGTAASTRLRPCRRRFHQRCQLLRQQPRYCRRPQAHCRGLHRRRYRRLAGG
mmetsp:Transcript_127420/g.321957  ORF Transcript_127420/g.321957 Transcript_127420/m.321957 type:complete len:287 (-) Transcript_127420:1374-2234(-)